MRSFGVRYFARLATVAALCAMTASACVKEEEWSSDKMERRSLDAWMAKNRPDLLENKQAEGGYYVDVLEWGDESVVGSNEDIDFGGKAIMEIDSCWMYYNITTRKLSGDVILSRNEALSRMQNTFTLNTHYVPFLNYCGETNAMSLLECSYLSTRNVLTLGEKYAADKALPGTEMRLRKGSKIRIYSPSSIAYGATGTSQEGGYEGQYTLDGNIPAIMEIEVTHTLKNPTELELDMIKSLTDASNTAAGGTVWTQAMLYDDESSSSDGDEEENKTLKGLLYNTQYDPENAATILGYSMPHDRAQNYADHVGHTGKYADMAALDAKIKEILVEKFGKSVVPAEELSDDTLVGLEGSAQVWYIGRFLDGFVFDTNIPEIRELLFDEDADTSDSTAISYDAENNKTDYIGAWYYTIPRMHYGRWSAVVTSSGYAYGSSGQSGSTTSSGSSSSSSYYDYYYNYYYGYNSAYYGDYYNYYNYYNYYDTSTDTSTETTITTSTEIMPYTPLVFYMFIEPKDE